MHLEKIRKGKKMKLMKWNPKTQYEVTLPILRMNEIFGLRVFEIAGRLRYTWSVIYISICITLYIVLVEVSIPKEHSKLTKHEEFTYKFVLYINIVVSMTFIVLGLIHTEVRIFKAISKAKYSE